VPPANVILAHAAVALIAQFDTSALSKITASADVGTPALSLVPLAVPQFVFPVAAHVAALPPPTQYFDAINKDYIIPTR